MGKETAATENPPIIDIILESKTTKELVVKVSICFASFLVPFLSSGAIWIYLDKYSKSIIVGASLLFMLASLALGFYLGFQFMKASARLKAGHNGHDVAPSTIPVPAPILKQSLPANAQDFPDRRIHVVSWEGLEHIAPPRGEKKLNTLLLRGSLEKLPPLSILYHNESKKEDFIVLVCDAEYIPLYSKRVVSFSIDEDRPRRILEKVHPKVRALISTQTDRRQDKRMYFPIRFGFQEILVNLDRVTPEFEKRIKDGKNSEDGGISHANLSILALLHGLKKDYCLGLWGIPHATLCQMAGLGPLVPAPAEENPAHQDNLKTKLDESKYWKLRTRKDVMQRQLASVLEDIKKDGSFDRLIHLDRCDDVALNLTEMGNAGIVLGAGTWALKPAHMSAEKNRIMALRPSRKEGLLAFVDCAAAIVGQVQNEGTGALCEMVEHWLTDDAQHAILGLTPQGTSLLNDASVYMRACPVRQSTIEDLLKKKNLEEKKTKRKTNFYSPYLDTLSEFNDGKIEASLRPPPHDFETAYWNMLWNGGKNVEGNGELVEAENPRPTTPPFSNKVSSPS